MYSMPPPSETAKQHDIWNCNLGENSLKIVPLTLNFNYACRSVIKILAYSLTNPAASRLCLLFAMNRYDIAWYQYVFTNPKHIPLHCWGGAVAWSGACIVCLCLGVRRFESWQGNMVLVQAYLALLKSTLSSALKRVWYIPPPHTMYQCLCFTITLSCHGTVTL